jgi:hypothetical protein
VDDDDDERWDSFAPGDPPIRKDHRLPLEEWEIVVPDVYPAYITYEQYLANRRTLRENMYNFEKKGRGAVREGRALLQGMIFCGRCGRGMTVSHGSNYYSYQCRHDAIEPENRLVARELEVRWNDALQSFEQLEQEYCIA